MRVNLDLEHIITQHIMGLIFGTWMAINYKLFVTKNSNSSRQQILYLTNQTTHLLLSLWRGVLFVAVAQRECRYKSFLLYQPRGHAQVLP